LFDVYSEERLLWWSSMFDCPTERAFAAGDAG